MSKGGYRRSVKFIDSEWKDVKPLIQDIRYWTEKFGVSCDDVPITLQTNYHSNTMICSEGQFEVWKRHFERMYGADGYLTESWDTVLETHEWKIIGNKRFDDNFKLEESELNSLSKKV